MGINPAAAKIEIFNSDMEEITMSDEISVAKVMDLKGLACPMPIVKVSKGIKDVQVGEVLQAVTSDPGALTDFPAWAKTSGNEILKTETEGKETSFYIKRIA